MQLHPALSREKALEWLQAQATAARPSVTPGSELEAELAAFAEAMAVISATVLPDDVEPH